MDRMFDIRLDLVDNLEVIEPTKKNYGTMK